MAIGTVRTPQFVQPHTAYNPTDHRILSLTNRGSFAYPTSDIDLESITPYVDRDLIVLMTRYPLMFDLFPEKEQLISALRSWIETHAYHIEGFSYGNTVSTSEYVINAEGDKMAPPTGAQKAETNVVIHSREILGQPIFRLIDFWLSMGVADPSLNEPLIYTLGLDNMPKEWLSSWYTMAYLAIEPRVGFSGVERAWYVHSSHPTTTTTIQAEYNPTGERKIREMAHPMVGVTKTTEAVRIYAEQVMEKLKIKGANPLNVKLNLRPEDLEAMEGSSNGYYASVKDVRDNQIPAPGSSPAAG